MTMADRALQDKATKFQRADVPIRVSRFIGVDPHQIPAQAAHDKTMGEETRT
jgi:hypothetical protein